VAAVTRKAGNASAKIEATEVTIISDGSIGSAIKPSPESITGEKMVHPIAYAMSRKAVTGWRATRRLSDEEAAEGWLAVVVDILCPLS
jgi:hypothetical protein